MSLNGRKRKKLSEIITGRSEAEVLGHSLEILFPPELVAQSMALISKTLTGER